MCDRYQHLDFSSNVDCALSRFEKELHEAVGYEK